MVINKSELVYRLAELFDSIELTPAEVDEELCEAGYDPDKVGVEMKAIADEALARGVRCIGLKERIDKPVRGERIVAFDKATPGSDDMAVIVKSRKGETIWCKKIENFIEN